MHSGLTAPALLPLVSAAFLVSAVKKRGGDELRAK